MAHLTFEPAFSPADRHPYNATAWERRTAEILREDGSAVFRQEGVEVPASWSQQATNLVAQKFFHGSPRPESGEVRESSARQLIDRVVGAIADHGVAQGYLSRADRASSLAFSRELTALLVGQYAAFNSPVWFNLGVNPSRHGFAWDEARGRVVPAAGRPTPSYQCSACFILRAEDDMRRILEINTEEGLIFKDGSGVGHDDSKVRSMREPIAGGGRASGPISFQRVYDRQASVTKSGGKTRRAARMFTLSCVHPDVAEFIDLKRREEDKARALIAQGYDGHYDGEAYDTVAFQNCNMSLRVTDEFLRRAEARAPWQTLSVVTGTPRAADGTPMPEYDAGDLLDRVAAATWACGDPGLQYADTIASWHTCPDSGPINSSNPCLRRGGRLMTRDGWRPVEDLDGTEPEIFDGVGFVKGRVWKSGHKPIVRVHLNSGERVDLTADHKIYTDAGWVAAGESLGRKVPRLFPLRSCGETSMLPRAITAGSGRYYTAFSDDLALALGFLQGDGGIRDDGGTVSIYYTPGKDDEVIRRILPILDDLAANPGEAYSAGPLGQGRSGYNWCRSKLGDWLVAIGMSTANLPERRLPAFAWRLKCGALRSFLSGLFAANGNVLRDSRRAVVLVSTCREMLGEVQLLLRQLGIMSCVRRHDKAQEVEWPNGVYTSKESWHLEITHRQDITEFARLIGFPQRSQAEKLAAIAAPERESPRSARQALREASEVVLVEDLGVTDDVYDFRSPSTSMGLYEGLLVHNCSEYVFLDDSACNLASINLMKFLGPGGAFDIGRFRAAVRVLLTAQEILVDLSSYPTEAIARNSHDFRPLGLGYCGLGASLMALGLPYDSDEARAWAAGVTALMHGEATLHSARMAALRGPFPGHEANREACLRVVRRHAAAVDPRGPFGAALAGLYAEAVAAVEAHGLRNAQLTLLAPTGTIAFLMDSGHSTGIEPVLAACQYKSLAGGGSIRVTNPAIEDGLRALGYPDDARRAILGHVEAREAVEGAPGLRPEHLPVFDCALPAGGSGRSIAWRGHLRMMAAVQPFLSGAISKTINMPRESTVGDIREAYLEGWRLGLKAVAIYRDGSKESQPVTTRKADDADAPAAAPPPAPARRRLPDTRAAVTHKFALGGHEGYLTVGRYEDGSPGELFVAMSKEGSTMSGLMDSLATVISIALQHGVPLAAITGKLEGREFEPKGLTRNPAIPLARSVVDYIAQWLDRAHAPAPGPGDAPEAPPRADAGRLCASCGCPTQQTGRCDYCPRCNTSGGCG